MPTARFETISGPPDVIISWLFWVDNCFSSLYFMYLSLLFPINSLVSISGSARLKVRYNVALFNTGLTPFTILPKMFKHWCVRGLSERQFCVHVSYVCFYF